MKKESKLRTCVLLIAGLIVAGCATYQPVPPGYAGPTALLSDRAVRESGTKAQLFVAEEIDGHRIQDGIAATARRSYGLGFQVMTEVVERDVPVRPMKVKIKATHVTGAPIHALLSEAAGTFFSVEGVVDFTPEPGKKYFVWGELKAHGSSVWISEEGTNRAPATEKITGH
jgi:hypothetical protein